MKVLTDERGAERIFAASIHCEDLQRTHSFLASHAIDEFGSWKRLEGHDDGFQVRFHHGGTVDIGEGRNLHFQTRRDSILKRGKQELRAQKVENQRLTSVVGLNEFMLLLGLEHGVGRELEGNRFYSRNTPMINLSQTREARVSKIRCPGCRQSNVPPIQAML